MLWCYDTVLQSCTVLQFRSVAAAQPCHVYRVEWTLSVRNECLSLIAVTSFRRTETTCRTENTETSLLCCCTVLGKHTTLTDSTTWSQHSLILLFRVPRILQSLRIERCRISYCWKAKDSDLCYNTTTTAVLYSIVPHCWELKCCCVALHCTSRRSRCAVVLQNSDVSYITVVWYRQS